MFCTLKKISAFAVMLALCGFMMTACDDVPEDPMPEHQDVGQAAPPEDDRSPVDIRERTKVSSDLTGLDLDREWEVGDRLPIVIADTLNVEMVIGHKNNPISNVYSFSGTLDGDAAGTFTLSRDGDQLQGNIIMDMPMAQYMISRDTENDGHAVFKVEAADQEEFEF